MVCRPFNRKRGCQANKWGIFLHKNDNVNHDLIAFLSGSVHIATSYFQVSFYRQEFNLILILTFNILITKLINTTEKFFIANFFIYIYIYIEKTNRFSISQKLTACIKLFHNIKSPLPKQKQLNRHQEKLSVMSSE